MIKAIYITPFRHGDMQAVESINVVANRGIEGDRYFLKTNEPRQHITFVEQEEIDAFNRQYGLNIAQHATRRNIITQGIRLNDLDGKEFSIGGVRFQGIELCEPCGTLGEDLSGDGVSPAEVVKALTHKAGLRAAVLGDGKLSVGMTFDIESQ